MISEFIDQYLNNYKNYKPRWNYEDGCVLKGVDDLYRCTGYEKYGSFVKRYADSYISSEGVLTGFNPKRYYLDDINSGKVLFKLYEETGDEKYRKAIDNLYYQIQIQPRTREGNFWHKDIYPYQVWLDGLYMVMPFYIKYEKCFGSEDRLSDIYEQFLIVRKRLRDSITGLYYHGYDETRTERWADKIKGVSPNFWCRAMGWLAMALIDVLEEMHEGIKNTNSEFEHMFLELMESLLKYQDENTGMWYQVVDKAAENGNYPETSGTLMIAYSLLKGSRMGYLPGYYGEFGFKAFRGTIDKYLTKTSEGYELGGICSVAGLGNNPYRDGSYEYYISEKITANDPKGVGAFLMAYSEIMQMDCSAMNSGLNNKKVLN